MKHGLHSVCYCRTLFAISGSTKVAANHRVLVSWRHKSTSGRGSTEGRRRLFSARITGNARPVCSKRNAKDITEAPPADRSPGHCKKTLLCSLYIFIIIYCHSRWGPRTVCLRASVIWLTTTGRIVCPSFRRRVRFCWENQSCERNTEWSNTSDECIVESRRTERAVDREQSSVYWTI